MLYDEVRAVEDIKRLPLDVRSHISHVIRNGMCVVLASYRLGEDVEKAIFRMETDLRGLGL